MEHDNRDVKELVGLLMRALDGQALTRAVVMDCAFEADGELLEALNEAYIKLLQYAHDCEAQETDRVSEASERHRELQAFLDRITLLYESARPISNRATPPAWCRNMVNQTFPSCSEEVQKALPRLSSGPISNGSSTV